MKISKENEYYGITPYGKRVSFSFQEGKWVTCDAAGHIFSVTAEHKDLFVLKEFLGIKKLSKPELQPA